MTLMAAGLILLLLVAVVLDQVHWWNLREDYLFGYLVPFFVGWVLYDRWPLVRDVYFGAAASPVGRSNGGAEDGWSGYLERVNERSSLPGPLRPLISGLMMFGCSVAFVGILFAALYRVMEGPNLVTTELLAFSVMGVVFSGVWIFFDRRENGASIPLRERLEVVGLFVFPACIWLLSAPMFNFIEKGISLFLMDKVAFSVFGIFDFLGFSVIREGNVLVLPTGEVGVEDACSGIRSLMACLFAGSFLAAVCLPKGFCGLWKKILMVVLSMVFAFFMNIVRSLFLTSWAYAYGSDAIGDHIHFLGLNLGTVHDFTGFAVIAPVVGALLLLVPLFEFKFEFGDADFVPGSAENDGQN